MRLASGTSLHSKDEILLRHIQECPGVRYRELQRLTGFPHGVLTYHLALLEESKVIRSIKQTRVARYFMSTVSEQEANLLKYARHEPVRQIMKLLLERDYCTFQEIISYTEKAPSTTSERLKTLKEAGIVSIRHGEYQLYHLSNEELVGELFLKYRKSLTDRIVDNYIDIVDRM